ncbi:serine/threonine protein kinase [Streptomyces venezuelae]|uniref:non-specific serine/threonine protein kinase n=1 Tax=Streptomyces venezuelae TaxID=54571 RepID=A0A5P2D588_STRVZ|nr:serine/threonine-protein kinase [Streptomyces venezuelae]QES49720.1 serine/threonine protein kinase [Streptomyces venezuelae]
MEHRTGEGDVLANRYRLVEPIGRGGMGKVWRAHDELLHRTVAVKELTAGLYVAEADRAVLHARTQKEARAAARIAHPAVVTVHDVFEHDDRPWIVMEYIDGPSLADAAKAAGRIEPREAARIGLHVLGALRAAHAVGVLHRDVKPGNVLLAKDGRVLLTDFGIAAIEGDTSITRTGELVGSIDYLAPERVTGGAPDPASDLWSLGATLYTAVEARSPFRRTSPISSLAAVVNDAPPPPRQAGALGPVITALLLKDPAQRPSAAEAERMLMEAMEGREPKAAQEYVPTQSLAASERAGGYPGGPETAPAPDRTAGRPGPGTDPGRTAGTTGFTGTTGSGTARMPGPADPGPVAGHGNRHPKGRFRRGAIVALLAALLGGGGALGVMKYLDGNSEGDRSKTANGATAGGTGTGTDKGTDKGTGKDTGTSKDGEQATAPAGYTRVKDPAGFTLFVPQGWKRQKFGDQIDYTPDNGNHRIRISVDPTPDYRDPYAHLLDLEKQVSARSAYTRVSLQPNTFQGQTQAALWEFSWQEKKDHPGPRRAIDQMYVAPNGSEYAVYMAGPASDWSTMRTQFDTVLSGWQPPASR